MLKFNDIYSLIHMPYKKGFAIILGFFLAFVGGESAMALSLNDQDDVKVEGAPINQSVKEKIIPGRELESVNGARSVPQTDFLSDILRNRLSVNMALYKNLVNQEAETKEELISLKKTITTLKGQLEYLDEQVNLTATKVKDVRKKIGFAEQSIVQISEQIEMKKVIFEDQKNVLADYLRLLYIHENTFRDRAGVNIVKVLLTDESISQVFQDVSNLKVLKETTENILKRVDQIKTALEQEYKRLDTERENLSVLKERLTQEQTLLEAQKLGKEKLLEETQNKESIFQNLLLQTKIEQEEVLYEVEQLKTNLDYFDQTTIALRDRLSEEDYLKALRIKESIFNGESPVLKRFALWPVPIRLGFSAYFSDQNYRNIFGVDHGAVDIPIEQGSPILAPADGIVMRAKLSNGIGYNYIAIAHEGGLVTVYGHVFAGFVKDGDFVKMGQIIGLTGGRPGTTGAGYRTTGEHLHIEVHYKGKRVDPMLYFPLEEIEPKFIPARYKELYKFSVEEYGDKVNELLEEVTGDDEAID